MFRVKVPWQFNTKIPNKSSSEQFRVQVPEKCHKKVPNRKFNTKIPQKSFTESSMWEYRGEIIIVLTDYICCACKPSWPCIAGIIFQF